jgi:hypothetical protein
LLYLKLNYSKLYFQAGVQPSAPGCVIGIIFSMVGIWSFAGGIVGAGCVTGAGAAIGVL